MKSMAAHRTREGLGLITAALLSTVMISCSTPPEPGSPAHLKQITAAVADQQLAQANDFEGDWLTYGKNYAEDRYSSLDQINLQTIDRLGLAWSLELGTKRGLEATPIVVDGILYFSGPWSIVYAVDARTGSLIWTYDPEVPRAYGEKACCDVVNRGVALYRGKVYIGILDGRLVALDASNGSKIWEVLTVDQSLAYTITGAPRVVKGKVVIGNGGAEYGVRGYVTAYDAETGEQVWRTFVVPGDPSRPFESEAMEMAAETWTGQWWKYGGGGTAWDAMAYDPELDLLYIGTGNGSPWNREHRSPDGGDNLFLSSILALNPDDGELVWYYQTTPGDTWDYTATQHLLLADLNIEGQLRKVIMQAPKNGFFYVLDRTNGELISAEPFIMMNWATHVDIETGRPVETEFARYEDQNVQILPSFMGGHSWQPMAYNHQTGLVYFPVMDIPGTFGPATGWKFNEVSGFASGIGWNLATQPDPDKPTRTLEEAPEALPSGRLVAWDPVQQKEVWRVERESPWNAGVLTTAGGIVFQGTADGKFAAYNAQDGTLVWEVDLGSGIIAPPVTYSVDGQQYVSLLVGWGGAWGINSKSTPQINPGTLYTFALDAQAPLPEFPLIEKTLIAQPVEATEQELEEGGLLYYQYCMRCHGDVGAGGGNISDLAYSTPQIFATIDQIVLQGVFVEKGMPNFGDRLQAGDVDKIKKYILTTAYEKAKLAQATTD